MKQRSTYVILRFPWKHNYFQWRKQPCAIGGTIGKIVVQPKLLSNNLHPSGVCIVAGALIGTYFLLNSPHCYFFTFEEEVWIGWLHIIYSQIWISKTHLTEQWRQRGGWQPREGWIQSVILTSFLIPLKRTSLNNQFNVMDVTKSEPLATLWL